MGRIDEGVDVRGIKPYRCLLVWDIMKHEVRDLAIDGCICLKSCGMDDSVRVVGA